MQSLLPTLLACDPDMLAIIAHRWDVDIEARDKRAAAETLAAAMLDPERAAAEWARLSDDERGALQMLLSSADRKMTESQFSRLFGEIRQMGPGRRSREKPHLSPVSVAEALYYRGLIALGFDQGRTGAQSFAYVPLDLAAVLPVHATGFDAQADTSRQWEAPGGLEPESVEPATTTLVDDLTTLLAYLRIHAVPSERETLYRQVAESLAPHWLGDPTPATVALLLDLAAGMGLASNQEGTFKPVPGPAREWLEQTRPRQVKALAEAWRDSALFNELWHTPGLQPEETGWRNDPLLARQTVLTFLEMVPPNDWWPLDELIDLVKLEEPEFQRPAGDYDGWYIRDAETGDYLRGFESWDRVDGAVLRFILTGPMRRLGLVDLGNDGTLCRLTVYGRAFGGDTPWPDPPEERARLLLEADGAILAPRTLSRYERFQLARITEWVAASDPYAYRLSAAGLQQASEQGIDAETIRAFLRRTSGDEPPQAVIQMLDRWEKSGGAEIWMTRAVILRAGSPDALQVILDTPELRRYLGAMLGPTAVIVRAGQETDLAAALRHFGILADFDD
jgi:hypothetical protein